MKQETTSLWDATAPVPKFESVRPGTHVDVAIVGAGITGLTAAVLLKRGGRRVAVIEKSRIGGGEPWPDRSARRKRAGWQKPAAPRSSRLRHS